MPQTEAHQPRCLHWVGWEAQTDTALVLVARDPCSPTIWYNRRHVRSLPIGLIELWALRRLNCGERLAIKTVLDLAAMCS